MIQIVWRKRNLAFCFPYLRTMNKTELANVCKALLEEKMRDAELAMKAAQESANSNEKSSMGDKYETGRAMGQLERDMHAKRLSELQTEYAKLIQINLDYVHSKVEMGALVQTETNWYWLAVALSAVLFNQNKVMLVSPVSPIAKAMLGKKQGDFFEFNERKIKILRVF